MSNSSKKSSYINRELSWLQFNSRVLEEAVCPSNPLLERGKFLAITASNLDEFVMVRVGGLILVAQSESGATDPTGMTAEQQLVEIRKQIHDLNDRQDECRAEIDRLLAEQKIRRLRPEDLNDFQRKFLRKNFDDEVVSTISAVSIVEDAEAEQSSHLSQMTGARLCVCIRIKNIPNALVHQTTGPERFVTVTLGSTLNRIVEVPTDDDTYCYILLEDLVATFIDSLIPGEEILDIAPFRITRNADVSFDEDGVADLLVGMQKMIQAREHGPCVRLEVSNDISDQTLDFLRRNIAVHKNDVYRINGPIDLSYYFSISGINGFNHLKDKPWPPLPSTEFHSDQCPFEIIASADRMLYHPYQEYDPVVDFIRHAAEDPDVIAIKQTLYRTSKNSEIVQALINAANNGKHVTVIVELKARFDEERNIQWARKMELAGVDVIYGVRGLKTHAKICIVVRKEPSGIQRYVHFATGNYNESTANLYSDVSYFTRDDQLGIDSIHFFNAITGLSIPQPFSKLAAAPINLREKFLELIQVETENANGSIGGGINAKLNSLVDPEIIDALYKASQAGVKIRLNVRGICCLRPGVKGLSENIKVISVVDRLLEHARIYEFHQNGVGRIFISSADWMGRNLDRRVELLVPIDDKKCKARLSNILQTYFRDNVKSRKLMNDGSYRPVKRSKKEEPFRCQEHLYNNAHEMFTAFTNPRTTVFKPRRGESA